MTPQVPIVVKEQAGPTMPVSLQNYAEWLREVKEKGSELLKKPPASVEPSLVSDTAGLGPPLALGNQESSLFSESSRGRTNQTPDCPSALRT